MSLKSYIMLSSILLDMFSTVVQVESLFPHFFFKYTHMIFETLIETDFVLLFPYTFVFCLPASGNIHHTVSQY